MTKDPYELYFMMAELCSHNITVPETKVLSIFLYFDTTNKNSKEISNQVIVVIIEKKICKIILGKWWFGLNQSKTWKWNWSLWNTSIYNQLMKYDGNNITNQKDLIVNCPCLITLFIKIHFFWGIYKLLSLESFWIYEK